MTSHVLSSIACEILTPAGFIVVVYSKFGIFWTGITMMVIGLIEGLDAVNHK
jgi:hypothetical protein